MHKFSHFILPGSCQVCVKSPILQLRKWRPRKIKSFGQVSIAGTRLSLDLGRCFTISQCWDSFNPTQQSALLPQGFVMLQNLLGILSSSASQPSSDCSVWTLALCWPCPGPALLPTLPATSDLSHPHIATVTPHTHCHYHILTKAATESHGMIPWDTPQKLDGVLGWFEKRPSPQVILELTVSP